MFVSSRICEYHEAREAMLTLIRRSGKRTGIRDVEGDLAAMIGEASVNEH